MKHKRLVLLLSLGLLLALSGSASQAQDRPPPAAGIFLKSGRLDPSRQPALPTRLSAAERPTEPNVYLVQFAGPIRPAWSALLRQETLAILGYIPDFTYKVRMLPEQARAIAARPEVAWVGLYQPAYKVVAARGADAGGLRLYMLTLHPGVAAAPLEAIRPAVAAVWQVGADAILVLAEPGDLPALASQTGIAWIEPHALPERLGDGVLDQEGGVLLRADAAHARGYDGSTQIIAVTDTGLSTGVASTLHPDLPASRIRAINDWPSPDQTVDVAGMPMPCMDAQPDGPHDVSSGHGTHVAFSAVGGGGAQGEGRGTAPAARLVFQAVEDYVHFIGICAGMLTDGYYLMGIPSASLIDLFNQSAGQGANVMSNSWGSEANGEYNDQSRQVDSYAWIGRSRLLVFAAGNSGQDADGNGVVDATSINAPATAKNVLTVGGSEGSRSGHYECDALMSYDFCAGQNVIFSYGDAWPEQFPANPLRDDPSAGNPEQLAPFSSRGPTTDGRIKPDVVAPATWVLSGYSDEYQEGYDGAANPTDGLWQYDGAGLPYNRHYKYMFGTSMATPLAAGSAAVVRDFYAKNYGLTGTAVPSALVKATLINTADDLLDENNDGASDNAFPIPNMHEGWGRINLDTATAAAYQFAVGAGIATGQNDDRAYEVVTAGQPCRVTLAWTDYPGDPAAARSLVNDLDLVVTDPAGAVYRGNVFAGGWSQTGGAADRLNNVENVYVPAAPAGAWTVRVAGYNVPFSQPYALVVRCALVSPTAVTVSNLSAQSGAAGITLRWRSGTESGLAGFQVYRSSTAEWAEAVRITGASIPPRGDFSSYAWTDPAVQPGQAYAYWVMAESADGERAFGPTQITHAARRVYLPALMQRSP